MNIRSVKLACFSPTGTTKSIVRAVAGALGRTRTEFVDLTAPEMRKRPLRTSRDELLIVAVPVYRGRVPELLLDWLGALKADDTPSVGLVVYGNREYDDALLELRDSLASRGCKTIACAAFIGEHSFSGPGIPIAAGRPDATDLERATDFGRRLWSKLAALADATDDTGIAVPGNIPYKVTDASGPIDFIEIADSCLQCGHCADVCPVAAIDSADSRLIDTAKCILCCACIKNCPQQARSMKDGAVKDIARRLEKMCGKRKEPVFFL